ncbi:MAG TPA: thiamine pyrophosphate-dependent enzyme, partial [Acidobacteriaceae bacterium]|nr:thiamine pyrophosphate-dependent enzyme [Acidobacteriaceae bacterium]
MAAAQTLSPTEPQTAADPAREAVREAEHERIFDVFRRWGYLQASLDPLGQFLPPESFPATTPTGPIADEARAIYCSSIGVDFMHIPGLAEREWLAQAMETPSTPASAEDRARILSRLIRADLFEQTIQSRYLGTKRFSLEGLTVLIPFLDALLDSAAPLGTNTSVLAMSHRGRLNVMTNTIGRSPAEIFARFEDVSPRSVLGGGDVKYHMGATGDYKTPDGHTIALHLVSNPSHLEAVDPVALGRARAKQIRAAITSNEESAHDQVLPITMHGDAAFAGQGILAECLVLGALPGFDVGGTVHVLVNNLLGFTALPGESNASRFASDIAKRLPIPILHVNAEDPDAVVRVARIAAEYRHRFHIDVVIDLIGYRRHGHSEVDDPTVTQPRRYAAIQKHPQLYKLYAQRIGVDPEPEAKAVQTEFLEAQKLAAKSRTKVRLVTLPDYWAPYHGGCALPEDDIETGLPADRIAELVRATTRYPAGFHIHPKVKKLFDQRNEM